MKRISEYKDAVAESLINLQLRRDEYPDLYGPIAYCLDCGGKRLRPVLLLMSCESLGGDMVMAMQAAVGVEMFHNFTLLHDDVMDRSELRRGRPTVHSRWNENVAILSGDAMLTLATEMVMSVPDSCLRPVLEAFNSGALSVYEGQDLDMRYESPDTTVSRDEYIQMVGLKTGALLGTSCRMGALIGGATTDVADKFYDFGLNLGIAFQIQDDYLDMYGDPATFGKAIGGDVQNNKKSFLYVSALERGGKEADALRDATRIPAGDIKLRTFRKIYDAINMSDICQEAVRFYYGRALKCIKGTGIDESWRELFKELADKLTSRSK